MEGKNWITVVPDLPKRRIQLLHLSHKLAALPTNQLDEMTFPKSSYQVGCWVSGVPPRQKIIDYTYTPPVAPLSIFRTLIPLLSRAMGARSWRAKIGLQQGIVPRQPIDRRFGRDYARKAEIPKITDPK